MELVNRGDGTCSYIHLTHTTHCLNLVCSFNQFVGQNHCHGVAFGGGSGVWRES